MTRSLILVALGLCFVLGVITAQSAWSQSSAESRLAEQLGSVPDKTSTGSQDSLQSRLERRPDNRLEDIPTLADAHGKYTVNGAERRWTQCPAWQDSAYDACECAANTQINDDDLEIRRKKRVAWRTACGVMALPGYSSDLGGPRQLKCKQNIALINQIRSQLEGARLTSYFIEARKAVGQWQENLQCEGTPVPSKQIAARCAIGERLYAEDQSFGSAQSMTCSNGKMKGFSIQRMNDFVFKISADDGMTGNINVKNNYDAETQTYYIDAGYVAGLICQAEQDASLIQRLKAFISQEVKNQSERTPSVSRSASMCVGVRG